MLSIYSYNIPFTTPFVTAKETFSHRKGFIIEYDGVFSEVAPLPGFSRESSVEVLNQLSNMSTGLIDVLSYMDNPSSWRDFISRSGFLPSVRFGVDMLWWQIQAKRNNSSLLAQMGAIFSDSVHINAVVPANVDVDDLMEVISHINLNRYSTVKLKVGKDWMAEFAKLMVIRSYLNDIKIRIDVNGMWSPKNAEINLEMCSDIGIEFCEQPVIQTEMADYFQHSNFQSLIAPDESLLVENERTYWIDNPNTTNLVIKTSLFGSYSELSHIVEKYPEKKFVFTSSLDSGVGNYLALHVAAHLGSPEISHGFGTSSFLESDVLKWNPPKSAIFKDFNIPFLTREHLNMEMLTHVNGN